MCTTRQISSRSDKLFHGYRVTDRQNINMALAMATNIQPVNAETC